MGKNRSPWVENLKQRARSLQVQTYALALACVDVRTPWAAKALAMLVVAYAFSPIDLIPDFIPVLGYLDDLVIVPAGIALALRWIPAEVMAAARDRAARELEGQGFLSRAGRFGAALVILIWFVILALVVFGVLRLIKH